MNVFDTLANWSVGGVEDLIIRSQSFCSQVVSPSHHLFVCKVRLPSIQNQSCCTVGLVAIDKAPRGP
jgi:hypothetical protein